MRREMKAEEVARMLERASAIAGEPVELSRPHETFVGGCSLRASKVGLTRLCGHLGFRYSPAKSVGPWTVSITAAKALYLAGGQ